MEKGKLVLSKETQFIYKCDNYDNKYSEGGIIYIDQKLSIDWKLDKEDLIVSSKDLQLPAFSDSQF